MSKKKYYSPEFKQEAVRLAEDCGNKSQVARDLGIHATMIGKWQQQLQTEGKKAFSGAGTPRDEEMAQLKKGNRRLQQEVEILKKAVGGSRAVSLQSAPREVPIYQGAQAPVFSISIVRSNASVPEWLSCIAETTREQS